LFKGTPINLTVRTVSPDGGKGVQGYGLVCSEVANGHNSLSTIEKEEIWAPVSLEVVNWT